MMRSRAFKREGSQNGGFQLMGWSPGLHRFRFPTSGVFPSATRTEVVCEEGWSYVAEWIGAPLVELLNASGILPQARYIVYFSIQPDWWESIDMSDALHPQTLLTYGMNDGDLPVSFGGPLRLRLPRQLGYKSVKFVNRVMVTDSLKGFVSALDPNSPNNTYSWYAGI
jgi:DMSO/TMAO reductase YedYZ molybdopterin-dependent catalytic subunit